LKRSLKRQIKQDELVSSFEEMGSWTRSHADELKATTIGVLVLAVAVGGLLYFRSNRAASGNRAFGEAMEAFEAIAPAAPDEAAPGAQAVAREEKLKKALVAFDGVAERFKSLPVGARARYFAGACRVELGQLDAAEQNLREVAARKVSASGPIEPALARLALAGVSRRKGALDAAVSGYRELLADPSGAVPKDYVLVALAGTLEQAGRLAEAAATFRRVVDEYPQSPFAGDARTRAEYLKAAATPS
jgi:tetratricopeptide (TPR) repeat protein